MSTRPPSAQARALLAQAIERRGPSWQNAADSVRAGTYANFWTEAALIAIDEALDSEREDDG